MKGEGEAWDPDVYGRFTRERKQPFYDLVAGIERPAERALDLGCGTGALTRELHELLGARETVGVDASDEMLARSAANAGGGVSFRRADLSELEVERPFDLVFSNAALHWVPDHERLFERLTRAVARSGQIAIQLPANHAHPSHRLADEVAAEEPFRTALGGYRRGVPVLEPEGYERLFDRLGYARRRVELRSYPHELASREDVVRWVEGSLLTAFRRRLERRLYERFLERYRSRLFAELPDRRPYTYVYRRILMWARSA